MSTIPLKRGNTLDLPMQVTKNGVPLPLSGKTLTYLVKEYAGDDDADAVLTFTVGSGLTITNEDNGNFTLAATAAQMDLTKNFYAAALQIRDDSTGAIIELPEDAVSDIWALTGHAIKSTV